MSLEKCLFGENRVLEEFKENDIELIMNEECDSPNSDRSFKEGFQQYDADLKKYEGDYTLGMQSLEKAYRSYAEGITREVLKHSDEMSDEEIDEVQEQIRGAYGKHMIFVKKYRKVFHEAYRVLDDVDSWYRQEKNRLLWTLFD